MISRQAQELTDDLRTRITTGQIRPGEVLPKIRTLTEEMGVSRSVVMAAYRALREEGLVEPRRNKGTVVLDPAGRERLTRDAMQRDSRGYYLQAGNTRQHLLTHHGVTLGEAPPDIAALLDIPAGADVIIRARVLGQPRDVSGGRNHDRPMILSTSYVPDWVATEVPAVRRADTGPGGLYDRYEDRFGGPLTWQVLVTAELATAEVSKRLSIARTSAILRQQRITTLPDGRPVEVLDQRVSGDKYELLHPIPRGATAAWPRDTTPVPREDQRGALD